MCKTLVALLLSALACSLSACRREEPPEPAADAVTARAEPPKRQIVVFPDELRVADDSVNEFVGRSMDICAGGRYDEFRLLWTMREDPLPRGEFEQGWQAVREIRLRALEPIMISADSPDASEVGGRAYAVFAEVEFDPALRAGQLEPRREVALLIVRERDEWRLAKAPKKVREWIKQRIGNATPPTDEPTTRDGEEVSPG